MRDYCQHTGNRFSTSRVPLAHKLCQKDTMLIMIPIGGDNVKICIIRGGLASFTSRQE
jgi:hypothetical protein